MVFTERYFYNEREDLLYEEAYEGLPEALAYCDHCGFAIYSENDALVLNGSGDIIHIDCWEEYMTEHMFDFAKRASEIEC